MPCTSPLPAWRPVGTGGRPQIEKGGWNALSLRERTSSIETFRLNCNACLSCRIANQRDLAVRAVHETVMHGDDKSWFLTLTYNPAHLPAHGALCKRDLTLFFKRFRKLFGKVSYLGCGEYGDVGQRPHYHVALWGHDFNDRVKWKRTRRGDWLYRSKDLERAWRCPRCKDPIGHAWLGNLEYESAAYVAGYTVKKLTGSVGYWAYLRPDGFGGMGFVQVPPEYCVISRGARKGAGGLGYTFYRKYFSDLFPKDYVMLPKRSGAKKVPVPRYYRKKLEEEFPELAAELKAKRVAAAQDVREDSAELRRARDETLKAERRLYGHPEDRERVDPLVRARLDQLSRRSLPYGDYEALARDVNRKGD